MRNRLWVVFGLIVLVGWVLGTPAHAEDKIGYVNLSLVFDSYQKTKDFDKELQQDAEAKRAEREAL